MGGRFGKTLKRHEHNQSHNRRRRRRHISNNDTSVAASFNHHPRTDEAEEEEEEEAEWDVGDLSKLDFSQVFADDEGDYDSSSVSGGGFLGRRAQHLVNLLAQPDDCLVRNILQIWDSDLDRIKSLDQRQILADVNAALIQGLVRKISPFSSSVFLTFYNQFHHSPACRNDQGDPVNSLEFLVSDVRRDGNGSIYHVGATMMTWLLDNNPKVKNKMIDIRDCLEIDNHFLKMFDVMDVIRMPAFTRCGKRISSIKRCTAT